MVSVGAPSTLYLCCGVEAPGVTECESGEVPGCIALPVHTYSTAHAAAERVSDECHVPSCFS